MNNSIEGKLIVITGASSGLGEAAAIHLSEQGAIVVEGQDSTTIISPGAVDTEMPNTISEPDVAESFQQIFYKNYAIPANSFARVVAFAINQPEEMDINEILYRPTKQEF